MIKYCPIVKSFGLSSNKKSYEVGWQSPESYAQDVYAQSAVDPARCVTADLVSLAIGVFIART